MPSTFAHGVFPGGVLWLSKAGFPTLSRKEFYRLVFLGAVLGNFPDLDLIPASFFPDQWTVIHRSLGHNIFSIFGLAVVGGRLMRWWVSDKISPLLAFGMALCLISSHLLLDSLGHLNPMAVHEGIPIFWPFSDVHFRFPFALFPNVEADPNFFHPILGFALSKQFWTYALYLELVQCGFLLVMWTVFFHGTRLVRHLAELRRKKRYGVTLP